jgi:hypothetical protein
MATLSVRWNINIAPYTLTIHHTLTIGTLWNINIAPYTVGPMAITGFTW